MNSQTRLVHKVTFRISLNERIVVPYRYNLVLVDMSADEQNQYDQIAQKISERFRMINATNRTNPLEDEGIKVLLLRRSRFFGALASKRDRLAELVDAGHVTQRTLIYCGEGRVQSDELDDANDEIEAAELQNIDLVTRLISNRGFRVSKFTSRERPDERRGILSMFRSGNIEVLTAIRCLDEGLNIPACETAFILASSANPRQFIQRRGRILRRSSGKTSATLWDFLALPPRGAVSEESEKQILRRELGRISEFSCHSSNFRETYEVLLPLLRQYDLGADFLIGSEGSSASNSAQ